MQVDLPVAESGLLLQQGLVRSLIQDLDAGGVAGDGAGAGKLEEDREIQTQANLNYCQLPELGDAVTVRETREHLRDATHSLCADIEMRVPVRAHVSGKIKAVDTAAGTISIAAGNGQVIVLGVVSNSTITVNGTAVRMDELCHYIGAKVDATFSAGERMMFEIRVDA